jgi:hypothetical protein
MADQGNWQLASESTISLKTSRIGLFAIHAHAPVVDGTAKIEDGEVMLEFIVAINKVSTGNPLLDPEVHALVNSGSDGRLTFSGTGAKLTEVTGHATAGNVKVPLELAASSEAGDDDLQLQVKGRTSFTDLHLPLPGMGHIRQIDVDIEGLLTLMRATANS